jgi:hypothetical protein
VPDTKVTCKSESGKALKSGSYPKACSTNDDCELVDGTKQSCTCSLDGTSRCELHRLDPNVNSWYWTLCNANKATLQDQTIHLQQVELYNDAKTFPCFSTFSDQKWMTLSKPCSNGKTGMFCDEEPTTTTTTTDPTPTTTTTSCGDNCATCGSDGVCTVCESGYEISSGTCAAIQTVTCSDGQYAAGGSCKSCSSLLNCKTCDNGLRCTSCPANSELIAFACTCKKGYVWNSSSKTCDACDSSCARCESIVGCVCGWPNLLVNG